MTLIYRSQNQRYFFLKVIFSLFVALTLLSAGCATTGRGEFPPLPKNLENRSEKTIAVLPPIGNSAKKLSSSIFYHLDRQRLRKVYKNVKVIDNQQVQTILNQHSSLAELTEADIKKLKKLIDAELALGLFVHNLNVEQFTTTETERLESTSSNYQSTDIDRNSGESSDANISSYESRYSSQEVPITEGNIRAVLAMSAAVYDLEKNKIIWSGRRIERAQDELKDLSAVELVEIVVERIMYRIISRLTA